jgi:DNA-directed RNA polymerase specialized sigma24 family protein
MQRLSPLLHAQISALLGRASAGRTRVRTSDAQDLLQDVLVELFRNRLQELRRWHPDRGLTLEGFVRLVARRFVVRRMRRLGRIDGRTDPADPDVLEAFETATHDGMRLESRDRLQVVLGALWGELGARDRELFERLFLAQEPPADVAAALSMSADALKKWRSRFYARATAIAERVDRAAKKPGRQLLAHRQGEDGDA